MRSTLACRAFTVLFLLIPLRVGADSTDAACGFSGSATAAPETTGPCVFSQRQGHVSVRFDDGRDLHFSPEGDLPGTYRDDAGKPVYRKRGLGQDGQLFQIGDKYLYVYWQRATFECSALELSTPGHCVLGMRKPLRFELLATTGSSLNRLAVTPSGLEIDNEPRAAELDGTAYRAEIADLDANGWPEVYVYVSSAGSGSYGSLAAWAVNRGKSMTPIYLPPLGGAAAEGYSGHDEFAVVESRLVRRFPLYLPGDTNAQPSGGTRQVSYRLEPGEAGWVLVQDRVDDF